MKRILFLAAALAALPTAGLAGTVTVKGSDTMVILAQRWAESYMKANPDRKVQVTGGGSGTGIAALINGTTAVATASRSIKDSEAAKIQKRYGVAVEEIAVAKDGVAFYVHASNPVGKLTKEQIEGIYVGDLTNWKEVGGPDAPIVVYSRENSSGTYVFVKEHVLDDADYTPRAQTLPGTAAVVNAVSKEKNGIGYGGAAYAAGVKEVAVVGADGKAYLPTAGNVQSGKYPLSRPLFMYTRGKPSGEVKQFIDYCLSKEGQAVVTEVGYYPIR